MNSLNHAVPTSSSVQAQGKKLRLVRRERSPPRQELM
jgi:hypothetical protein